MSSTGQSFVKRANTTSESLSAPIKNFDHFRRSYMKEFKFEPKEPLVGKSLSQKNKMIRQEFLYLSDITQHFLEDMNNELQDHKLDDRSEERRGGKEC